MKEFKIKQSRATSRMGHLPVEGGGLNAGYDTVDAKWKTLFQLALQNDHRIKHTDKGEIKLIKERR